MSKRNTKVRKEIINFGRHTTFEEFNKAIAATDLSEYEDLSFEAHEDGDLGLPYLVLTGTRPIARKPKKKLVCQDCKDPSKEAKETICPFMDDIHGEKVNITACDDCVHDRAMEI